jgi:hypothetical protein
LSRSSEYSVEAQELCGKLSFATGVESVNITRAVILLAAALVSKTARYGGLVRLETTLVPR